MNLAACAPPSISLSLPFVCFLSSLSPISVTYFSLQYLGIKHCREGQQIEFVAFIFLFNDALH
uniref:Uncharacterized protein n=1 Tax=Octopus bimaculoides TaxID=37653 RepID=A0A0L8GJ07_OCTBM